MVSLVLLAGVLVLTWRQEGAAICEAKIHKGQTKDGVTYQYDTKTKTLTMSGKTII